MAPSRGSFRSRAGAAEGGFPKPCPFCGQSCVASALGHRRRRRSEVKLRCRTRRVASSCAPTHGVIDLLISFANCTSHARTGHSVSDQKNLDLSHASVARRSHPPHNLTTNHHHLPSSCPTRPKLPSIYRRNTRPGSPCARASHPKHWSARR